MTLTDHITIKTSKYVPPGSFLFVGVDPAATPDPTNIPAYSFDSNGDTGFYTTNNNVGLFSGFAFKGITYEVLNEKDYQVMDPFDNTIFETHGVLTFPGEQSFGDPSIDGTILIPNYYRKAYFPNLELIDEIPLKIKITGPDGPQDAFVLLNTRNQKDTASRIYRSGKRYTITNPKLTIITDNLQIMKILELHRKIRFINLWKGPKC